MALRRREGNVQTQKTTPRNIYTQQVSTANTQCWDVQDHSGKRVEPKRRAIKACNASQLRREPPGYGNPHPDDSYSTGMPITGIRVRVSGGAYNPHVGREGGRFCNSTTAIYRAASWSSRLQR